MSHTTDSKKIIFDLVGYIMPSKYLPRTSYLVLHKSRAERLTSAWRVLRVGP